MTSLRILLILVLGGVFSVYAYTYPEFVPPVYCLAYPYITLPNPFPGGTAKELQAYSRTRFNVLLAKDKQWDDSGGITRWHTLIDHPQLDNMARYISDLKLNETLYGLPPPLLPPICVGLGCPDIAELTNTGVIDPFSADIIKHAHCLFTHPNVYTYNATSYSGNPGDVIRPRVNGLEVYLGHPTLGIFSCNIFVALGETPGEMIGSLWAQFEPQFAYPRHNWMGIGIEYYDNAGQDLYVGTLIMVHECAASIPDYVEPANLTNCPEILAVLGKRPEFRRCMTAMTKVGAIPAGANNLDWTPDAIYCNKTDLAVPHGVPVPVLYDSYGDPIVCQSGSRSIAFTEYGYVVCSGACVNGYAY